MPIAITVASPIRYVEKPRTSSKRSAVSVNHDRTRNDPSSAKRLPASSKSPMLMIRPASSSRLATASARNTHAAPTYSFERRVRRNAR